MSGYGPGGPGGPEAPRRNFASGGPWEELYGYARAVRVGRHVHVAGTTAARPDGGVEGGADVAAQTHAAIDRIEAALAQAGARLADVVRTRLYAVPGADTDAIGRAHGERFAHVRPASTLVVVHALVRADLLVEVEADAVLPADAP
jgi:enamine deaminase RidA (YjgF/YER057c/UK114 family)